MLVRAGLPKEFIEELEKEFGFDKPPLERFFNMLWNYMRFDFGESYFRLSALWIGDRKRCLFRSRLGFGRRLIAYLISIPLGIRKAVHDGRALTHGPSARLSWAMRSLDFCLRSCC